MASMHINKPAEKNCHQPQHGHSFGEKILGMASAAFKGHTAQNVHSQQECYTKTETRQTNCGTTTVQTKHCQGQTQINNPKSGHHFGSQGVMPTPQSGQCIGQANGRHQASNGQTGCNGKTNRRTGRKRGLLHKIKDGVSRHSDNDTSSSSSSESESDDEKRSTRKSC